VENQVGPGLREPVSLTHSRKRSRIFEQAGAQPMREAWALHPMGEPYSIIASLAGVRREESSPEMVIMKKRSTDSRRNLCLNFKFIDCSPEFMWCMRARLLPSSTPPHATAESHGHMLHVLASPPSQLILPNTSVVTWYICLPGGIASVDNGPAKIWDPNRDSTAGRFRAGLKR
jgi:hypothetical protein